MEATIDDPVLTSRRNWRDILDRAATEPFGAGTAAQARKMLQDPARQRDPQLAPRLNANRDQMAETLAEISKIKATRDFHRGAIAQGEIAQDREQHAHSVASLHSWLAQKFEPSSALQNAIDHHTRQLQAIDARLTELNAQLATLRKEEEAVLQAMLVP